VGWGVGGGLHRRHWGLVGFGSAVETPDDAILARCDAAIVPKMLLELRERRVSGTSMACRMQSAEISRGNLQEIYKSEKASSGPGTVGRELER